MYVHYLTGTYDTLQNFEIIYKVVNYVDSLAVRTYIVCTTLPINCHFESYLLKNANQNLRYHF